MFTIALITCKLLEYNVSEIQEDNTNRPMWKIRCLFLNEWCKWWHAITFRNLKLFCICFLKLITKSVLVTLNITIQYTTDIKAFPPHCFRKDKPLFYKFCNFQHLCELIKTKNRYWNRIKSVYKMYKMFAIKLFTWTKT